MLRDNPLSESLAEIRSLLFIFSPLRNHSVKVLDQLLKKKKIDFQFTEFHYYLLLFWSQHLQRCAVSSSSPLPWHKFPFVLQDVHPMAWGKSYASALVYAQPHAFETDVLTEIVLIV